MCHHPHPQAGRAVSIEQGAAHDHDHSAWSRRDFLVRAGFGAAAAVALGTTRPAHALVGGSLLDQLSALATDRVLVLIQLKGGNDGLNTVVPLGNDVYHNARPQLALGADAVFGIADGVGLHNGLLPLQALWGAGQMAVVHSVGYANSSLSHFTSTDIWTTARLAGSTPPGGWGGRTMRLEHPDFPTTMPVHPPAVQLGAPNPLLFQSGDADLSMMIASVDQLSAIQLGGGQYDPSAVPATPSGAELSYARQVANASNTYVGAVRQAATAGRNEATYPNHQLGRDLAAIARLIKGGLQSRIFVVSLGGFDTHANQLTTHATLLTTLAGSVAAFYQDLAAAGHDQRTLAMTFSEFGRRVAQNGSAGTDHGTAAPLFVFGPGTRGGLYGAMPDLTKLDRSGNVSASTDFRQVYASVLGSWFGIEAANVDGVLGGSFAPVPFVGNVVSAPEAPVGELTLDVPAPNPVREQARFAFTLPAASEVRLEVFDTLGREVAVVARDEFYGAGAQRVTFDAHTLPAGVYVARLRVGAASRVQRFTVVR